MKYSLISKVVLTLMLASLSTFAATKKEKYMATVEDGTAKVVNALKPVDEKNDAELDSLKSEVKVEVKAEAKTEEKFDIVPNEKINEIAERVKYTYEILKRHGRAYDYKSTTLSELKTALKQLEEKPKQ